MFDKPNKKFKKIVLPGEQEEVKRKRFEKKEMVIYDDKRLWEYSIWLLSRKDYTVAELTRKLKTHQTDIEKIQEIIDKLVSKQYLNDERRARNLVNNLKNKDSISKITQRLSQKGVSKEIIKQVLEENIGEDEQQETANNVLVKKFKIYNKEMEQKYYQFLANRGFSWDIISKATQFLKNEYSNDEEI